MRLLGGVVILSVSIMASGCATVVRGTTDQVKVQTVPEGAAIRTSNGLSCPSSPCEFKVKRKEEFTIFAEKEGYKPSSLDIVSRVSGKGMAGTMGNVLVGGVIGIGVDAYSGATLSHSPNPAILTLEPLVPEKPLQKKRIPAKGALKTSGIAKTGNQSVE